MSKAESESKRNIRRKGFPSLGFCAELKYRKEMLNGLSLFSGIGGLDVALSEWVRPIAYCEIDPYCQAVLLSRMATGDLVHAPIWDDIKTLRFRRAEIDIDIIYGGSPCQGFSVAGKKRGRNDNRYLWPEMYRIIQQCRPNWIIAENVVGIVEMELDNIIDDLAREGYETQSFIIPACAANAPHRRDRLWIVANAMRKRCDNGIDYWESRSVQENKEWDVETLQSEWQQLKPESWQTMSAKYWLKNNAYFERTNDGISGRLDKDRIKALGNSIVPQVVYPIMKSIYLIEQDKRA